MYAQIIPNCRTNIESESFTYKIPENLEGKIKYGQLVKIPFRKRKIAGLVTELISDLPKDLKEKKKEIKEIEEILTEFPVIDRTRFKLAKFISNYYFCPISQVIFSMIPPKLRKTKFKISLNVKDPLDTYEVKKEKPYKLTCFQKNAFNEILKSIKHPKDKLNTFLLHGITGSGKTEIYLQLAKETLKKNKSVIFIVPEISLTPQTISRFLARFPKEKIGLIHSQLTPSQRLLQWLKIRSISSGIVIGSRSAIFAPVKKLGLIIIDEEHDLLSFKSDSAPRYQLHQVAENLAKLHKASLVLGSATPRVESYYNCLIKRYKLLLLPERIKKRPLPLIKIVDMKEELKKKNFSPFSELLLEGLKQVIKNKRKALIFINRRGTSTTILCPECGWIKLCPKCEIPLVYHSTIGKLLCHHCDFKEEPPLTCPVCKNIRIKFLGTGTQKIELELKSLFPEVKILRMDKDTTIYKDSHKKIFEEFKKENPAILIGTQMISKGWDIPEIDLVGILGIDFSLSFPDFRTEEKAFQTILQIAGRTGRGNTPGIVILQTYNPSNEIIQKAKNYDFKGFIYRELEIRKKFSYPPFGKLIKLTFSHKDSKRAEKKAVELVKQLKKQNIDGIKILGPNPCFIPKLKGKYWWQIIIKILDPENQNIKKLLKLVPSKWIIDIDPISLL